MNYSTLQSTVAGYLHRTDLTSQITLFIDLARLRLGGDLRALCNFKTGTVTTFSNNRTALPSDYAAMAAVQVSADPLLYMPPGVIASYGSSAGVYSVDGNNLVIMGAGASTVATLSYYSIPAALSVGTDVSAGMDEFPQLWIYASVAEGALYVQDFDLLRAANEGYAALLQTANRAGLEGLHPAPAVVAMEVRGLATEARN